MNRVSRGVVAGLAGAGPAVVDPPAAFGFGAGSGFVGSAGVAGFGAAGTVTPGQAALNLTFSAPTSSVKSLI